MGIEDMHRSKGRGINKPVEIDKIPTDPETWLTLAEVVAITRLQPNTVRLYIKEGKIQATKCFDRWRIKRGEVDRIMHMAT